jgi:hypothetical protein
MAWAGLEDYEIGRALNRAIARGHTEGCIGRVRPVSDYRLRIRLFSDQHVTYPYFEGRQTVGAWHQL